MKEIPVKIGVGFADYEIGYLKPWPDDPTTFDAWLSETKGGVIDELVVNGADQWWARYLLLARYMEVLMAEIGDTEGKKRPTDRLTVTAASERLKGAAEEMEVILAAHLAEGN
ncbi:hypothetical protein ACFW2V_13715 [Streptomyces sp. NPDC058947]|uniref:hypothetical protein n=1 Tax=Streptomyces sp. NPDC058947 TaxID=3346675 RepID=UPI0036B92690